MSRRASWKRDDMRLTQSQPSHVCRSRLKRRNFSIIIILHLSHSFRSIVVVGADFAIPATDFFRHSNAADEKQFFSCSFTEKAKRLRLPGNVYRAAFVCYRRIGYFFHPQLYDYEAIALRKENKLFV